MNFICAKTNFLFLLIYSIGAGFILLSSTACYSKDNFKVVLLFQSTLDPKSKQLNEFFILKTLIPDSDSSKGILLVDNGKTYYYFENGMMRDRIADHGDNLWRTSLAYIAYGDTSLRNGMLQCAEWIDNDHVQFYRSVEYRENDVSRDQITMFLAAMVFNNQDVKKYAKGIKWKISNKYKLTLDMWLWIHAIAGNSLARRAFLLLEWPVVKVYQIWNKGNISKQKFPAYALHLLAWQMYVLDGNSGIQSNINLMIISMADEENLLVRLLAGDEIYGDQVDEIKPFTDFIWQRYRNNTNALLRELTPNEAEFNALDVDVLKSVFDRERIK